MTKIHDDIIKLLTKIPSECISEEAILDYKRDPYEKINLAELIRDVIAMLNVTESIDEPRIILFGVEEDAENVYKLVGIDKDKWSDDNEYQHLFDHIAPRPKVSTGICKYEDLYYGYIYIYPNQTEWVYEVSQKYGPKKKNFPDIAIDESYYINPGQSYVRHGSNRDPLSEAERVKLRKKRETCEAMKRHLSNALIDYHAAKDTSAVYTIVSLIGSWNEAYSKDKLLIARVYQDTYENFIENVRVLANQEFSSIEFRNGIWKSKSHIDMLMAMATSLNREQIEQFLNETMVAFLDPLNLDYKPNDFNEMVRCIKDGRTYSPALLNGLGETLAILGTHPEKFKALPGEYYLGNKIYEFEFEEMLFWSADWKVMDSISGIFQWLAEASPNSFLDNLRSYILNREDIIKELLKNKFYNTFTDHLIDALKSLAINSQYFTRAIEVLFILGKFNHKFVECRNTP